MTQDVESREKELTHQIHRELLIQHLDQIKNLTPSFISSIKVYLLITSSIQLNQIVNYNNKSPNNNPVNLCLEVKEFLIKRLTFEIDEIIRILQMTSHEEDEWISDEWFKQKIVILKCIKKINEFIKN